MDIALIPNRDKPDALRAADQLLEILSRRKNADASSNRVAILSCSPPDAFEQFRPQLVVVLGGDGSILMTAQALGHLRVPVVGINFGKLGYLAAYSMDEFLQHLDLVLTQRTPTTQRLMLEASIVPWAKENGLPTATELLATKPRVTGVALNDVVINAGEPFRLIELEVQIDGQRTTTFRSDGLVVATASGSTGYNLSAGGPLISPEVEAMVLTPICPYTLSFRPVVLPACAAIVVFPHRLNPGSRVNLDGQVNFPLTERDCLLIRRAGHDLTLVENPTITHWQMLAQKLHWARSPRN